MAGLDIDADGVATVALRLRARPASLFDPAPVAAFAEAIESAIGDDAARGVIVVVAPDADPGGSPLVDLEDPAAVFAAAMRLHALTRRMETCGKPFAAAMEGSALGGAFEIALACHRRFAADDASARFGLPEVAFGLPPGGGGAQRLVRMTGAREALAMLLGGKRLDGHAARAAGLVDALAPPGGAREAARDWLAGAPEAAQPWDVRGFAVPGGGPWDPRTGPGLIAANARAHARTRGNEPAVQAILSCVYEGTLLGVDAGLKVEARWFAHVATGAVARNMVRTLFVAAGAARRLAKRPPAAPRAAFSRVGILGAGMMGAGIAGAAARAGIDAVLLDRDIETAARGKARALDRMSEAARADAESRIAPTADHTRLSGCELVVEAVFEDRAVKADATRKAEAALDANAVFASNTSTLPITGLAEASVRPANFIGLHFFSPVERMKLVEIIRGRATSDATLARAMDFVARIDKVPIVVDDSRGFYTSRVFGTYVREGFAMLEDGVGAALVENAGRMAGMAVGPLAVADEVSLELMRAVSAQTRADLGDSWRAPPGEAVLDRMVAHLGRAGRKAGRGFYDYPRDGRKRLWPGLAEHFPPAAAQPGIEDAKRRLLFVQSLEAARCLDEGVLESAEDGDIGALLGWGFPASAGGPLSSIDTIGADAFVAACDRLAQVHGARFSPPGRLREMAARGARFHDAPATTA